MSNLGELKATIAQQQARIEELQDKLRPIDDVRKERDQFMDAVRVLTQTCNRLREERDSIQHQEIHAAQVERERWKRQVNEELQAERERAEKAEALADTLLAERDSWLRQLQAEREK